MWRQTWLPQWQIALKPGQIGRTTTDMTIDVNGSPDWICRCTAPDDLQKMLDYLASRNPSAVIQPRTSTLQESAKLSATATMNRPHGDQQDLFAIPA